MAGDWIRIRVGLRKNPKLIAMARFLHERNSVTNVTNVTFGIVTRVTMCALTEVWGALNSVLNQSGEARYMTLADIDDMAGFEHFGEAMKSVGWVEVLEGGGLKFPNFSEHNTTEKARAVPKTDAERAREYRERRRSKETSESGETERVTKVTRVTVDKRRVDKSINTETHADASASSVPQADSINAVDAPNGNARQRSKPFQKPTVCDVSAYAAEINATIDAKQFVDYYESNGWRVGRNPMKDWKATLRQWESRRLENRELVNQSPPRLTATQQREAVTASGFDRIRRAALASRNQGGGPAAIDGTALLSETSSGTD